MTSHFIWTHNRAATNAQKREVTSLFSKKTPLKRLKYSLFLFFYVLLKNIVVQLTDAI